MKNDKEKYKYQLAQYLAGKGIQPGKNGNYHCISPNHADSDPSMTFYEDNQGRGNYVNCNSCGFKGDIFDCSGAIIGSPDFVDQLNDIKRILGDDPNQAPIQKTKKKDPAKYISLPRKKAYEIYTDEKILEYANFVLNTDKKTKQPLSEDNEQHKKLTINKFWAYYNADGDIDLMVVRFDYYDKEKKKDAKDVLTYYWDGQYLKMKAYPVLLYSRDELAKIPGLPVLFHEGEKCCDIAKNELLNFCHITWNGGGKKLDLIKGLEILEGRDIYILGDDDKPGQKTASHFQARLKREFGFKSYLVPPFMKAREVKKKGADIVEILQRYSIDEINKTILGSKHGTNTNGTAAGRSIHESMESKTGHGGQGGKREADNDNNVSGGAGGLPGGNNDYPFQILGIADDSRAYFLDYENRMINYDLTSLSDKKLIGLAGLQYFKTIHHGIPTAKDWLEEIDYIMQISKRIDFDTESIRGRGAWRDSKGNICYHDGQKTTGKYDKSWTFVRRPRRDIGIADNEADPGTRSSILKLVKTFSFATSADAVRLLAWAVLAPFGGALKWRPAILVTGESGTGKSTVLDNVLRPISVATAASGTSTTEAGIRQYCGLDSNGVSIDEAERRSKKDKERMEGVFSLMRGSTTDDAPKSLKGSISGVASTFQMRSMFCFAAIDPTVDDTANDNRIIRINFRQLNNFGDFTDNMKQVKNLLSNENCRGIRAFTWNNLEKIIACAEAMEIIIQKVTGQDARFSAGESILLAANMIIWEGYTDTSESWLYEYITDFYKDQKHEEKRDETNEMIERLLDETVIAGDHKEPYSFRELLIQMKKYQDDKYFEKIEEWEKRAAPGEAIGFTEYQKYKRLVEQHGLSVHGKTRELFIVQNHHQVKSILQIGNGYHRQIERHKNVINPENGSFANIDGTTKRGVIVGGFLGYGEVL